MTRRLLIIATLLAASVSAVAQVDMRGVLSSMPESVVPYLTENNRLDLIDFAESGMTAQVTNTLTGTTRLDTITSDYARLQLTPATVMELRLLPQGAASDSIAPVLCVVTTVGTTYTESTVAYFTPIWRRLPSPAGISLPTDGAFVASLSPGAPVLTITPTTLPEPPATDDAATVALAAPVPTAYRWNGAAWEIHN